MSAVEPIMVTLFWLSTASILYCYIAYPALIWLLSRLFGRTPEPPVLADLPSVTLLIAAHNEQSVIEQRIQNALALDYPRAKLHILIASDGSTDDTAPIVSRYANRGIGLLAYPANRGKSATLNAAMSHIATDLVVFSDANTAMSPDSLLRLVRWFTDPSIGVVCGRLILSDPDTSQNVDSAYWRYETFLKTCESRLGALLGANGAIYALRRSHFQPIPSNTIVDDFVIPLAAKLATRCRILYDPDAIAQEESAPSLSAEFRRRSRIGAGGFQAIVQLYPLLNPLRGWVAFTFLSHKLLRWLCPFALLATFLTSLALCRAPLYSVALYLQAAFYLLALAGLATRVPSRIARLLKVFSSFALMNVALAAGFCRWLRGSQTGAWARTPRPDELHLAA